ncbi:MAG: alpha/beta fold hydrolase [Marinomonas foliarum]|jgi:pimeloyl-[acyl-carrier protein] methyl ester esterase|uniref:Alpha/beta fold hydrolase n=1 Tax=Marinomonas foliarum TaxID=491950 RepID=A0A369AIA6_9GAMM|nr:alpha/beta fold hydrolase [Marinomonas foliarum]QRV23197.1 alpha/beta fold hydrolase [Marinomonas foliarum]RCX08853.1 pimeloyl-[acyl-carrier protein] methyl ester esterase [Marinomonas foliarum]
MRVRIETESFGNASNQAIFMVSGWAMPKEVMRSFALRLSERFYVVVANLPSISLDEQWISRSRIGPNYDIDALSEQLIDAAPNEAWWIGWSLGGMVSAYVAARRSSCVLGLITLSASPSFVKREGWESAMPVEDFDAFAGLVEQSPEEGLKRFVMLQAKGAENERALVKQLQVLLPIKTLNRPALIGGLRLLRSLDVRREWSLLDLPNLHILGGKDALVSSKSLEQQTDVNPLQQCVVLSNCAHQPFLEDEEACVRHVENFIDANNS